MVQKYFIYNYSGEDITVGDFIKTYCDSQSDTSTWTALDFLSWSPSTTPISVSSDIASQPITTNRDNIFAQYSEEEAFNYQNNIGVGSQLPIKNGTLLTLPYNSFSQFYQPLTTNLTPYLASTYTAWWNETQQALLEDKDGQYRAIKSGDVSLGTDWSQIDLSVRVWLYSKALDSIINITPFVVNINTNKSITQGSCDILMQPIGVDTNNSVQYFSLDSKDNEKKIRTFNFDFCEKNIQENDLIFVRFEKLQMEGDDQQDFKFIIDKSRLAKDDKGDRVWDFIGLINSVNVTTNSINKVVNINCSDFTKLLSSDINVFQPSRYMEGVSNFIYTGKNSQSVLSRVSEGFTAYWFKQSKPIKDDIEFIINYLSSISVVPSSVFDSYGTERRKRLELIGEGSSQEITYSKGDIAKGMWSILKTTYDDQITKRIVFSQYLQNPNSDLFTLLQSMCLYPLVEIVTDVYTNKMEMVFRQPPFTKKDIKNVLDNNLYITVSGSDIYNYSLSFDNRISTWFEFGAQKEMGIDQTTSNALLPTLILDEMVDIYGCRRRFLQNKYIPSIKNTNSEYNLGYLESYINDLLFLVETEAHLPFTRKGVISFVGDRRIKVGSYILFEPTNELFYVTNVSQSAQIGGNNLSRTTSVSVERGMRIEYYEKYFEICKLQGIKDDLITRITPTGSLREDKTISTMSNASGGVNTEILDFFLKRKQFSEKQ